MVNTLQTDVEQQNYKQKNYICAMQENWFKTWFNTPYYHILYKNRDYKEAENFIHNLIHHLQPKKDAKFLDIACGKGRHSYQIHQMGFPVVGYDLSEESINEALQLAQKNLEFYVHDMRAIFRTNYFDFALNLFTSFGYFQSNIDEQNAILSAQKALKPGGTLVLDFLNKDQVISNLVEKEQKTIDGIVFNIHRKIENSQVIKEIRFTADGKDHYYTEQVKLLGFDDFQEYFSQAGLKIKEVFGNYNLSLRHQNSERLILIAEKQAV